MNRVRKHLPGLLGAGLFIAIAANSPVAADSVRQGLKLCGETMIPALFPLMTAALLLAELGIPERLGRRLAPTLGHILGISGPGACAFLLGISGGYPLGASAVAALYQKGVVKKAEARRLLGFCNNSGPAFILGAVGTGVFGDIRWGLLLYACHVLAALTVGLITRPQHRAAPAEAMSVPSAQAFSPALVRALGRAARTMLSVCAAVVFSRVLCGMWETSGLSAALELTLYRSMGLPPQAGRALQRGFLELSCGLDAMAGLSPTPGHLALAAFLLGWGGLSVHAQTRAVAGDLPLSAHAPGRLLVGLISAALVYGLSRLV